VVFASIDELLRIYREGKKQGLSNQDLARKLRMNWGEFRINIPSC